MSLIGEYRISILTILRNKINFDDLVDREHFYLKRSYAFDENKVNDKLYCRILGIRKVSQARPDPETDVQWVEIIGS